MRPITVNLPSGTDDVTRDIVRQAVEGAVTARDQEWAGILQRTAEAVVQGMRAAQAITAPHSQSAAELALDVIRQALPEVFATVEQSVREATIVRAADGQIRSVITRTIDAA